jgi:hypothetical protein
MSAPTGPDVEALREALRNFSYDVKAGEIVHAARCWLAHVEAREADKPLVMTRVHDFDCAMWDPGLQRCTCGLGDAVPTRR